MGLREWILHEYESILGVFIGLKMKRMDQRRLLWLELRLGQEFQFGHISDVYVYSVLGLEFQLG